MLRVKSFKITDDKGINDFLQDFSLASGMHILVSEGNVLIPVEDGTPKPDAVLAVELGEDRNKLVEQREIILHSEKVNDLQRADLKSLVEVYAAEEKAATANPVRQEAKRKKDEAQGKLNEVDGQTRLNKFEIVRLSTNIELFEEEIKRLSK